MKSIRPIVLALAVSASAFAAVTYEERTQFNITRAGNSVETFVGTVEQCRARLKTLADASKPTAGNPVITWDCRTQREILVARYAADPPPQTCTAPQPPNETRPQTCPAGTTGSWSQSRTYTAAAFPTCWVAGAWTPATPSATDCVPNTPPPDPTPGGSTFTDLSSAPSCAQVTIYPAKTVVSAAASGLPIHTGRCLEATPATFNQTFWAGVKPGDVVTLRAGTYTTKWGEGTWSGVLGETFKRGTAAQPIAVVAAPGETVTMTWSDRSTMQFGNGTQDPKKWAEYLTFGGINFIGRAGCASGGGDTTDPSGGPTETGGRFIRIVGGSCTMTDATSNTMTGLIEFSGDGWKVLGVKFRDPANRVVINNNHAVYLNGGGDDSEVAFNDFQVHTGHVIQVHQDGTPKLFERLWIHDNVLRGANYGDMRGVTVTNVDSASTVKVERNKFSHLGQSGWGCMNFYRGVITVNENDCTDTQGGLNTNAGYGGTRKVTANGNLICPISGSRIGFEGTSQSDFSEPTKRECP